jgi:GNAT superfamily N-acetyltransferase
MYDGAAIAAAELRFLEDLWRTAPSDAVIEAEVRMQRFGPILATVFADLPSVTLVNTVMGAAEPAAVDDGHLGTAVEWLRSREVDYRVSVSEDRPGTTKANDWLLARGYEPGSAMRRYLRPATTRVAPLPAGVTIRELGALETEGMSHIVAKSLDLSGLATVLIFGLPEQDGWRCYSARLEGREVACGSMLTMNKLALLALDATMPAARGHGCHTALIARRLADAARAGCDSVVAEVCDGHPATPSAVGNLTRAGFLEIPGATNWRRPTGLAP